MAVLVPFYLSMYNNIIEVIFMTNIDQLDKILQSLNTELQKNKEIEDLKQIDDKFMENVISVSYTHLTLPTKFRV